LKNGAFDPGAGLRKKTLIIALSLDRVRLIHHLYKPPQFHLGSAKECPLWEMQFERLGSLLRDGKALL
jgi:hypothetical protein